MKFAIYYKPLALVLIFLSLVSCKKTENESNNDPANLSVQVTVSDTDDFTVIVTATAENTTEYRLYIDEATEPVATNSTGQFEYTFTQEGMHKVEVRAYGASGKYLKYTSEIPIGSTEVPLENGYTTPMQYSGMQLVWNDEFDGTQINTDYWTFETGAGGWGNNEMQYYRRENAWAEGGTLTIEARKESFQGSSYTSTRMITKNKKSFKYGRVDIRALLPKGQGIWPALWMLGDNISSVGWPKCGENDIMEMIGGGGRENTVYGTIHWEDNTGHAQTGGSSKLATGTYADKYHVFSMIWDETSIKYLVDDNQYYVVNITPSHMTEFHQPFFFIFNIAVGGRWPGYPDATTKFPQRMKVDYIRVFQ